MPPPAPRARPDPARDRDPARSIDDRLARDGHRSHRPDASPSAPERRALGVQVRAPRLRAHAAVDPGHARALPRRQRLLPLGLRVHAALRARLVRADFFSATRATTRPSSGCSRRCTPTTRRRGSRTSSASRRRGHREQLPRRQSAYPCSSACSGIASATSSRTTPTSSAAPTRAASRSRTSYRPAAAVQAGIGIHQAELQQNLGLTPIAHVAARPADRTVDVGAYALRTWTRDHRQLSPIQDGTMYVAGLDARYKLPARPRHARTSRSATTTWTRRSTSRPRSRSCTRREAAA